MIVIVHHEGEPMGVEFLGSGWGFPVGLDDDGQVRRAHGGDSIRDAVWLVLSTAAGERVMRPDFGCGIQDLLFEAAGTSTAGLLIRQVREALIRWEPRIDVLDVTVRSEPESPSTLLLQVDYQVRGTNTVFNLVYPFYLGEPDLTPRRPFPPAREGE
jgi:phage baseplate assembly protein W